MSTRDLAWAAVALALVGCASATVTSAPVTEAPNLGHTATPAQIAGWDIDVRPDGTGLPKGSGSVKQGESIYDEKCASCHGTNGVSQRGFDSLAGQSKDEIVRKMQEFKAGTKPGTVMPRRMSISRSARSTKR